MTLVKVLAFCGVLSVSACRSESTARPGSVDSIPVESRLTIAQATALVQGVPGAKSHSLGVESPDSVVQKGADAADVKMLMDGERMTMHFVRRAQEWEWHNTSSTNWPEQIKSPGEVLAWLAARTR